MRARLRINSIGRILDLRRACARTALAALASAASPNARAEYRAYRIAIGDASAKAERIVATTLDPLQYSGYHPLKRGESTRLVSSWMCRRRSDGFAPICPEPAPKAQPPAAAPPAGAPPSGAPRPKG